MADPTQLEWIRAVGAGFRAETPLGSIEQAFPGSSEARWSSEEGGLA